MSIHRFAAIAAAFSARHKGIVKPQGGKVDLQAGASSEYPGGAPDTGLIDTIQAGAVHGYQSVVGKLQWVRAYDHFYAAGSLVSAGDVVELDEASARSLVRSGRATLSSQAEADAEIAAAAAQKKAK